MAYALREDSVMRVAVKLYGNEDGLGPTMGVYYVVKGLVELCCDYPHIRLDIRVQSRRVSVTRYLYAALGMA